MTKSEACLWKYVLQGRRLKGFQFRRQRPVMNYIADFMSKELRLIIEVDGITHTYEEVALKDERRQKVLESVGFKFLRFTDEEVLTDINGVRMRLEGWIEENKKSPPPIPRQRGRLPLRIGMMPLSLVPNRVKGEKKYA